MGTADASQSSGAFTIARQPYWKRLARRIGKRYLSWKYRRFSPESEPDTTVKVGGLRLAVLKGVFNPSLHFTSETFAAYLKSPGVINAASSVLDLGTGSGIVALTAALAGAHSVVATDINPQAVRCAEHNVRSNELEHVVSVRVGDMFGPVHGERFDLVLCNPPYFRGEPQTMADRAFRAGESLDWIKRFAKELQNYLEPSGSCIVSLGDAADIPAILGIFEECGWSYGVALKRDILVEVVYLFRLTRSSE